MFKKMGGKFKKELDKKKMKGKNRLSYWQSQVYGLGDLMMKKLLKYFFAEQAIYFLRMPSNSNHDVYGFKSTLSEVSTMFRDLIFTFIKVLSIKVESSRQGHYYFLQMLKLLIDI